MLYKNDEKYVPSAAEIKNLEKIVGNKFPVTFKMAKGLYSQNPNKPLRTEFPGGVIINFEERVDDPTEGSVKWNYCELPPRKQDGNIMYYTDGRGALFVSGPKFSVAKSKIDLLYFLVFVSKSIKVIHKDASPYTTNPLFVLEDTHLEALERNKEREKRAQVEGALFGHQKLVQSEVVRMAKAFRVPNAENMTDDEVRDSLYNAVQAREQDKNKKDGYSTFLELCDNKQRVEILGLIQRGKDMRRLTYEQRSAKWWLMDENGKKAGEVCRLMSGKTPDESLEYQATTNEEVAKILERGIPEVEAAVSE